MSNISERLRDSNAGRPKIRAVFLDRDGVLNRDSDDFIRAADELEVLPGVAAALRDLAAGGYARIVVTNQSGIARGLFSEEDLLAIHRKLEAVISSEGAGVEDIYVCPHGPEEGCGCRKPRTGLVMSASTAWGIDLAKSWFVGDRPADIACGVAAGCRTILALSGKTRQEDISDFDPAPDHVCADLAAAARVILAGT